jgi:hypothetical protein
MGMTIGDPDAKLSRVTEKKEGTHVTTSPSYRSAQGRWSSAHGRTGTGSSGEERLREAYPPATHERLVALMNRYDSTNLFRLNHNVRPTIEPVSI